jgi:hypothetical protein
MKIRRLASFAAAFFAVVAVAMYYTSWSESRRQLAPYIETDSMGVVPSDTQSIPVRAQRALIESSGAAMNVEEPGIIFTINDSGNEPILFALDTTGADRGSWRLVGASNADWEAMSIGSCGGPASPPGPFAPDRCLYIGDVGDNSAERTSRAVYRVEVPRARERGFVGELPAQRLTYTYEDSPHDVEAMYVGRDGAVNLITKRSLRDADGRPRPALVFVLPGEAWDAQAAAVARLVDSLPIVPGSAPLRVITDASLSSDSRYLAVRTYGQVYVFATDSTTSRVIDSIAPTVCNIIGLAEPQGEGITWYGSSRKLLLTSEKLGSPLHVIACPLPPLLYARRTPGADKGAELTSPISPAWRGNGLAGNEAALVHEDRTTELEDDRTVLLEAGRSHFHDSHLRPRRRFAPAQHLGLRVNGVAFENGRRHAHLVPPEIDTVL